MIIDGVGIEDLVAVVGEIAVGVVEVTAMRDVHGFQRRRPIEGLGCGRSPVDQVDVVAFDHAHSADVFDTVHCAVEASKGHRIASRFEFANPFPSEEDASRCGTSRGGLNRSFGVLVSELGLGFSWPFLGEERRFVSQSCCITAGSIDVKPMHIANLSNGATFTIEFGQLIAVEIADRKRVGHLHSQPRVGAIDAHW